MFTESVVRHWYRLLREVVELQSVEMCVALQDVVKWSR